MNRPLNSSGVNIGKRHVQALHAITLGLALPLMAGAADPASAPPSSPYNPDQPIVQPPPPAMLPLLPEDDFEKDAPCRSAIYLASGERLALLGGSSLTARLNIPTYSGKGDTAPSPIAHFSISDRARSLESYRFEFIEFRALSSATSYFDYSYLIKMDVSNKQACPTQKGWLCNDYTGTLDFSAEYSPPYTGKVFSTLAPSRAIRLHDECPAASYKYGGLFVFPGFLDYLGGFILGGH